MNLDKNITNHGINSAASVRHGINRNTNIDPFYTLRQAELAIKTKRQELIELEISAKAGQENALFWEQRVSILEKRQQLCQDPQLGWLFRCVRAVRNWAYRLIRLPSEQQEIVNLKVNLARHTLYTEDIPQTLRDLRMELTTAQEEKERFYKEHPEFVGKTYEELQQLSDRALDNRIAATLAAQIAAQDWGSVVTALIELPSDRHESILEKARELQDLAEGKTFDASFYQLFRRITETIPPTQRDQFLVSVSALAQQTNLSSSPRGIFPVRAGLSVSASSENLGTWTGSYKPPSLTKDQFSP